MFAVKNEDRFEFTYGEFADVSERARHPRRANNVQMLRAIDFTDHPTEPGLLRPPRRFKDFEKGTMDFPYNPVSAT